MGDSQERCATAVEPVAACEDGGRAGAGSPGACAGVEDAGNWTRHAATEAGTPPKRRNPFQLQEDELKRLKEENEVLLKTIAIYASKQM